MVRLRQSPLLGAAFILALTLASLPAAEVPTNTAPQGIYFAKKKYVSHPLPKFDTVRSELPAPIFEERAEWVRMYWKTWELAFRNFHEPQPGSGFVSQFIDAAFNQNIFLWDTAFMTMFCNYGHGLVPGIGSLDNFYARQHADGEISREIDRRNGQDYVEWRNTEKRSLFTRCGWNVGESGMPADRGAAVQYRDRDVPLPVPLLTLDALNHPILAWAELESLRVTGNQQRIPHVYEPLARYYEALKKYLRQGNGLYITDWASMDNSPRNPYLKGGGCAVDTSSQMVLFARQLASMAENLGERETSRRLLREAEELAVRINNLMWDPQRRFYYDLQLDGTRAPVKTIAAFWTLLAGVARSEQQAALIAELNNPQTFKRLHRVPTLAADQRGYDAEGGYWRGAVWAPTTMMVVRGLERCGKLELAREIALDHLQHVGTVFQQSGTIWENYAPDSPNQGRPAKHDFVGWSGLGPIQFLLENAIGLKPEATKNELVWDLNSSKPFGCERYRFNGHIITLRAEPLGTKGGYQVKVDSDAAFNLVLRRQQQWKTFAIKPGQQELKVD